MEGSNSPSPTKQSSTLQPLSSGSSLISWVCSELLTPTCQSPHPHEHISDDEDAAAYYRRREKVYTFVQIPKELEKLMAYGFFLCNEAFLYVFTFLPLRCLISLHTIVYSYVCNNPVSLKPSDKCELLKVLILAICSVLFMYIDTNVLYHVIKSQSVIKLYIFFNMLEVGDRLFSSFSQDSLDALFITATEQHAAASTPTPPSSPHHFTDKSRTRSIKKLSTSSHALICGLSILGHALVILLQSTTLSVAINANNRALLTVMMSNNFVELKGSVFKKFDKMNLFQVSCSDIRERFHLFVLLLIVCLQTLREYSWEESRFWVLLPDCLMVLLAEILVDWLKHAFITRFNELPLDVYNHYTRSLAYDMAYDVRRRRVLKRGFGSDYSDVVGRRLGFVPLPLAIVLIRVVTPMWKVNDRVIGIILLSFVGFVGLASFRVLNMIVLVGKAVRIIDEHAGGGGSSGDHEIIHQERRGSVGACDVKNSILKRARTISGSDGDLLKLVMNEKVDKKLKFEDELKSEVESEGLGKIHLFANSNVSLTSVGFNEEMMKVEAKIEGDVARGVYSERKHSLGSNLCEGVMLGGRDGGGRRSSAAGGGGNSGGSDGSECAGVEGVGGGDVFNESLDSTVVEVKQEGKLPGMEKCSVKEEVGGEVVREQVLLVKDELDDGNVTVKREVVEEECDEQQPRAEVQSDKEKDPGGAGDTAGDLGSSGASESGGSRPSSSGKKKLINWFK